ncbi:response regulator transcription factor [Burkholderia sp. Ac-20379]|uniref:response regulator transcription factor n=1 Tax=Burkholderia sp. Ac-20379 TaxID=2703900 RepID=UPI00197F98CC|nr:response regulator transcription factor [Burkholderia sp. Ac-20379]MBN3727348.1 response regulator transcription factor [Burkholderia sp. Ac-20379]
MKVAILGGPANQARQLELWLRNGGHQSECFKTGNAFFNALRRNDFELLMVDVALPDMGGVELIAWVRQHFEWHMPVIAMMARDAWHQAADALKAGADDYLVRPAREAEVQSRIATVALRHAAEPEELVDFGAYTIDVKASKIRLHGEPVSLTRKEFELATYFLRHPDQLVSHETLLNRIWKLQSDIDTRTVATHVSRIRKKLQLDGTYGCEIMSLYGYGYRCLINLPETNDVAGEPDEHVAAPRPDRAHGSPLGGPTIALALTRPAASQDTALMALAAPAPSPAMSVAYGPPMARFDSSPAERRDVADLLRQRQDAEEQLRKLRDAYCEVTLELRALKRQGGRRLHEIETNSDYREDAA